MMNVIDNAASTSGSPPTRGKGALPRIHLASRSARRQEILTHAGIDHDAAHPGLDDGQLLPGNVSPERWSMALAYLKAASAARSPTHRPTASIVIGADTVVVKTLADGHLRLIGQPKDLEDAWEILRLLREGEHRVVTGVAMLEPSTGRRELFSDSARVQVGSLSDERIAEYLASGSWRGKAGGYNLSERIQDGWPIAYHGDPTTIMGLPITTLLGRLGAFVARGAGQRPAG